MLKKYKILILAIILTAGGITLVLSTWLYGSYQNRKMFFLGASDHILFDVIQDFYQENEDILEKQQEVTRFEKTEKFLEALSSRYGALNQDTVRKLLGQNGIGQEDLLVEMNLSNRGRFTGRKLSKHIISAMAIRDINWDQKTIDTLSVRLERSLRNRNLYSPFQLNMVTIEGLDSLNKDELYKERLRLFKTRPILIDPSSDKYLEIDFQDPRSFLVYSIGWQLSVSIVLVLALIGTFFYLLATIQKQNKLAVIRRSFVNNMTHELKTPVSTVMAAIEAIQRYGARNNPERMEKYLNISKYELEHLSNMIERVLQVDIAETNGVVLNKTSFDLVMLVQECAESTKLFSKKSVQVNFSSQHPQILVLADQAHLKNVVSNLLDNAVKYSADRVTIDITLSETKDNIILQISDDGNGISKEYHKAVFDLFFRVPSGDIHDVKGFGLGLAYVKQIINQHGGEVQLESTPSIGSNFVIKLPRIEL